MGIIEVLKKDHKKVLNLLDEMESTTDRATKTRQKLFEQLKSELLPHMHTEENYFYQYILDKVSDKEQRESILEGIEEHRAARGVFEDAEGISFTDERWQPDVKVLKELVSHHIEEEESEIFEVAEEVIEDSDEMAEKFQEEKMKYVSV